MTLNLSENVLQKRVFKQQILDLHIKEFMLGQTKNYLSKDKNAIDVGAATGMYSSFQNLVNGQKIEVETIKLDNFKLDNIGFMKIDVEGVELDVLNGASEIIKEYKPTCMVEVYEKFNKYPVETTFDYFFSRGYKCFYNERAKGLKQVSNINEALEEQKIPQVTDGDFLFTI